MSHTRKRQRKLFVLGISFLLLVTVVVFLFLPSNRSNISFTSWYKKYREDVRMKPYGGIHQDTVHSKPLKVDQIYRSMQGPYDLKQVNLFGGYKELLWLTGYSSVLLNENGDRLSDGFMCHNNLNITQKKDVPWRVKTHGSNTRLFTLTEGQTRLQLPEGFGVPFIADADCEVVSQVLNHNYPDTNFTATQQTVIDYYRDVELETPLIPLYQQAVFVTKQTSGPIGDQGSHLLCNAYEIDSTGIDGEAPKVEQMPKKEMPYNPYLDAYGRRYTGHWTLPQGESVEVTNVTQMLNLEFDTRIHFIGAHVHPFAKSIALLDLTSGDTLQTLHTQTPKGHIGIDGIEHYSSKEGLPVFQNHEYATVVVYDTPEADEHTAMATLFLYLRDLK